ncbi:MAG TPA: glycosyltransferase [Cyclobacteriaceae bacterium]|nr:glycosyltransferase [Cyclobacteriaceae bacterium]
MLKMIIAFIIDTLQTGGAEKSLLEITARFKKYKPVFFQLYPGDALLQDFKKTGIEVKQFNFKPDYNFKETAQRIAPALSAAQPDLIHSTLFRADMVSRHLSKRMNIPLINSLVNNSYSWQRYKAMSLAGRLKLFGIQWWDRFTSKQVDLFISNSRAIQETNAKALNIPAHKIKVIYRGRDINQFHLVSEAQVYEERQRLGVQSKKVFLNVSRLLDRKGQLDLVQAYHKVYQQNSDTILLVAGEGVYRYALEQEIEKLNLRGSVVLLGNRTDVPVLLKLADYFVFPSHYEGLPGALIEAMFSKTPIIASAIPENIECVSSDLALFFPAGNVDALAERMLTALDCKDWQTRIEMIYNFALQHFEINKIADQYEATYDQLLLR